MFIRCNVHFSCTSPFSFGEFLIYVHHNRSALVTTIKIKTKIENICLASISNPLLVAYIET